MDPFLWLLRNDEDSEFMEATFSKTKNKALNYPVLTEGSWRLRSNRPESECVRAPTAASSIFHYGSIRGYGYHLPGNDFPAVQQRLFHGMGDSAATRNFHPQNRDALDFMLLQN